MVTKKETRTYPYIVFLETVNAMKRKDWIGKTEHIEKLTGNHVIVIKFKRKITYLYSLSEREYKTYKKYALAFWNDQESKIPKEEHGKPKR